MADYHAGDMSSYHAWKTRFAQARQSLGPVIAADHTVGLPIQDAFFCADDERRNRQFFAAIERAVHDLDAGHVVDAGAGIGILGLMALWAGASSVTMIEVNPSTIDYARRLVDAFGYADRVKMICADATSVAIDRPIDILISETITADFGSEDFVAIVEHLQQYGSDRLEIIPAGFELLVYDANYYCEDRIVCTADALPRHYPLAFSPDEKTKYIGGAVQLYDDIYLRSGECISFFNMMPISRDTQSEMFAPYELCRYG